MSARPKLLSLANLGYCSYQYLCGRDGYITGGGYAVGEWQLVKGDGGGVNPYGFLFIGLANASTMNLSFKAVGTEDHVTGSGLHFICLDTVNCISHF
jgi:hypothetical protein